MAISFSFNPFTRTLDEVGTTATTTTQTWIVDQIPVETPNGVRTLFTAPSAYIAGSLRVMLNGQVLTKPGDFSETSTTTFTFVAAPLASDTIRLDYRTS